MDLRVKSRPPKAPEVVDHHIDQAIADAHAFVTGNYQSGDQVILLAFSRDYRDHLIKAMEAFARHLHDGITPGQPFVAQPGGGNDAPGQRIPIHAVAVLWYRDSTKSMCLMNDGLKSRFPPGIEHIICHWATGSNERSCSTVFDSDGAIISREISMYNRGTWSYLPKIHTTKHVIYYKPERIPDWDEQQPVWNKELDSSPSGIPRNFPLSTLPTRIYQQELSRYQGEDKESDRLVWKLFRH